MIRVFLTRAATRIARKERIADKALYAAAIDAASGTFRADLGDETFKVGIARVGGGKSGGYRSILGLNAGRAVHVFLWPKNDFENINESYLAGLKTEIRTILSMDETLLQKALTAEVLREIVGEKARRKEGDSLEIERGKEEEED